MALPTTRQWPKILKSLPGYDPYASAAAGDYFDAATANKALSFFENFVTHIEGELAGDPFILERWQQAFIGNLLGWKRKDGTRRYRESLLYIPRKNGKTTLTAGLVLLLFIMDDEPGAQIYSAAADREQAALVFRQCEGMVRNKENVLGPLVRAYRNKRMTARGKIGHRNSFYSAISAEAATKHGYNSHAVVIDELHAQPNRELVDVLLTSTGARRQPLVCYLTTADYQRESICNEIYERACRVRDDVAPDRAFLPAIFEALPTDDWTDKRTWEKANPNLGVSLKLSYLEAECQKAQDNPALENTFKRLHLNIRTEQDVRWMPLEVWDTSGPHCVEDELLGHDCYLGVDLSSTDDFTCVAAFFPDYNAVLPFYWIPTENGVDREKRDRIPISTWARLDSVRLTDGNVVDYDAIRSFIRDTLAQRYNVREVVLDAWNSQHLQTQLDGDGFTVIKYSQGFASMSAPMKRLFSLAKSGELTHFAHPVLRWNVSNTAVEMNGDGEIRPSKKKSNGRIDGVAATVMAIGRAMLRSEKSAASIYEERGALIL